MHILTYPVKHFLQTVNGILWVFPWLCVAIEHKCIIVGLSTHALYDPIQELAFTGILIPLMVLMAQSRHIGSYPPESMIVPVDNVVALS